MLQLVKKKVILILSDVIKRICNKMINRHPHVFGTVNVNTSEEVLVNWDKIKKKEKGFK